jgi:hypothetical protein
MTSKLIGNQSWQKWRKHLDLPSLHVTTLTRHSSRQWNPRVNKRTFSGGHAKKAARKRAKKGGKTRDVLDVTDEFEDAFGRASVGGDGVTG